MKRPTVKPAPGDRLNANRPAKLMECTFTNGQGFLMELREVNGALRVDIYRADKGIEIAVGDSRGGVAARIITQ